MLNRFSLLKIAPLLLGLSAAFPQAGCGTDDLGALQQEVTETKAAQINQTDLNGFTDSIKLKNCTFVITGGNGTFTPSNELSQVIFGDPMGSAHKVSFPVPNVTTPTASIDIKNITAEFNNTGVTLAGSNATVKLAFNGLLHIEVEVPIFGKLPADIQIKSSSISAALTYDAAAERVRVASVTSKFDATTKNCGGWGWCNGIVDGVIKTNLSTWIDAPMKDALAKALDSASITSGLQDGLVAAYNIKDKQPTAWSMVPKTMTLASGAFNFTAQRDK